MDRAGEKLRVGILLNSLKVSAWHYAMLERIAHSDYAQMTLVVLNDAQMPKQTRLAGLRQEWHNLLYLMHQKFEHRHFRPDPDAFANKDARNLLTAVPTVAIRPRQTKFSDYIEDKDIEEIRKYDLDVFIRLGFRILRGKILQVAKYGVWSFHHGDNNVNRGGPAGFWEVLEHQPATGSILQILTEDLDNGIVLSRSYSATDEQSVNLNRNNFYWKTLSLLPRKLAELHRLGPEQFFAKVRRENAHPVFYSNRLYTNPTNGEFAKLFVQHLLLYARAKCRSLLFSDQWVLLFDLRERLASSLWRFKKIIPPKDRYWADPQVISKDHLYYIFLEEFVYAKDKGHIAMMVMGEDGNFTAPVTILERPYHVSYPFVFEWQGEYYMIPESGVNHTIEVYKCKKFPDEWEWQKNLMENIKAVDTTLFHDQRRWWLFTNIREHEGASSCDELFLFYADDPLSETWYPHPQNPIVSDVRRARSAGRIFAYNGQFYRPTQDCSRRYGYGIKINHIVQLNTEEYEEREVSAITPTWEKTIKGVHTISHAGRLTIVDGVLTQSFLRRSRRTQNFLPMAVLMQNPSTGIPHPHAAARV
jgi:hypothetical protein